MGSSTYRQHVLSLAKPSDLPRLLAVWESSVRATHGFLTDADTQGLSPLVWQALTGAAHLYCVRSPDGRVAGFLMVQGAKVEMLFVHAESRATGAGRALLDYAVHVLGATRVDVNEQNEQAVEFYRHFSFRPVGRSERDAHGNPFPILHLELDEN